MIQNKPETHLTADVITEILLRLPAKNVGRVRCVNKLWRSLTSDPYFIRTHHAISASGFFLYEPRKSQDQFFSLNDGDGGGGGGKCQNSDPTLSFLSYKGFPPRPLDSCNGLILCSLPRRFEPQKGKPFLLSVCNPLTKEHDVITFSEEMHNNVPYSDMSFFLAFDPSKSLDFKIIAVVKCIIRLRVYKYLSKTRSWSLIGYVKWWSQEGNIQKLFGLDFKDRNCVYWDGSLFWWQYDQPSHQKLLGLDVERDQIRELFLPQPQEGMRFLQLGESRGRLHFITGPTHSQFQIWEMASESSGWHLLHSVHLYSIKGFHDINKCGCHWIAGFTLGGDEAGDHLLLRAHRKIVSCHLQKKTFTTICEVWVPHSYYRIFPIVHTLVPLSVAPSSQEWVCWKSEHDRLLISLMVEYSLIGKKNKDDFKSEAWHDMVRKFNKSTQLNYNIIHLKYRLTFYKREYGTVKKIVTNDVFHWDPSEKMVKASSIHWRRYLRRHPTAVAYNRKQVPFEQLKIICESFVNYRRAALLKRWY